MKRPKVSIFGAGGTGVATAEAICSRGNVDVVLIDVYGDMAKGRALDVQQTRALTGCDFTVRGGDDLLLTEGSDVVVITAGRGRQPGMQREALLQWNGRIIHDIASNTARLSPEAHIVVLTNPADVLARVAQHASGFPVERVTGQGGILDSARLSGFVAEAIGVSVRDVRSMVLGGHGDTMVPLRECTTVHGVPVSYLLSEQTWADIVHRTRFGGGELLRLFGTHGAAATPGHAVAQMVNALLSDTPRLLPVSAMCNGSYGISGVYLGLPVLLSHRGAERIIELPLGEEERAALQRSAVVLEETWQSWLATQ